MNKVLLFLLCFVWSFSYSSNDTLKIKQKINYDSSRVTVSKIPPEVIQKYLQDPEYGYVKQSTPPKSLWQQFLDWFWRSVGDLFNTKAGDYSITIIKIAVCIAIIVLIIRLLFKNNSSVRSIFYGNSASAPLFNEINEDIHEIDFDKRISEELAKNDFRKAIRFLFLKLIKELNNQKLINWQLDKTNADYYRELRNTNYGKDFKELSRLYEYVWYGDFKLDEPHYKTIIQRFNQFKISRNR
ncbi:MAG TPA: DUF4129 domain-containing protein [Bacteroidia bacterium]|jgi:hypothetical protein|nr:DUF4129 domain-containing protein [Bacteroidia bacterium]